MKIFKTLLFCFPGILFGQEDSIVIKHLSNSINSTEAELNFFVDENNHAFFMTIRNDNNDYSSSIYESTLRIEEWSKGRYSKSFNSDFFQSGNLFITKEKIAYFTFCDSDKCTIYKSKYSNQKWTKPISLEKKINQEETSSTQPSIAFHNNQQVLYFVSNRKGGAGGLDIWISVIDSNGNFETPINAGKMINSKDNEITPFYHQEQKKLFFSSNRENGLGGYDIYSAKGSFPLWEKSNLLSVPLNSEKDEMYLTFYQKNKGYFSSNRSPALFEDVEHCCNDIFSFEYLLANNDSVNSFEKINEFFPLSLYFHNDEPDCCTMKPTTKLTYKESYISYLMMQKEYVKQNTQSQEIQDFFNKINVNFNKLDQLILKIKIRLDQGEKIELQIKGYASPLFESKYNINLSKRRIASFFNYLKEFQNGKIIRYIKNGQLIIAELPLGESRAPSIVSDNPRNKKLSIYSLEAALERKIEIVRMKKMEE